MLGLDLSDPLLKTSFARVAHLIFFVSVVAIAVYPLNISYKAEMVASRKDGERRIQFRGCVVVVVFQEHSSASCCVHTVQLIVKPEVFGCDIKPLTLHTFNITYMITI
jgi:hypothetical protein